MKPAPFEYVRAELVEHAVAELAERGEDAAVLAGGQSLIALMNLRMATPAVVIDIGRLDELATIVVAEGSSLRIGATVRASRCERDRSVLTVMPVLPAAIAHIGHPQIRSRTTIGGNVAHADPASELPAVLVGLDGVIELTSREGIRTLAAQDFFQGTWATARRSDELLTRVDIPLVPGLRAGFAGFARRPGDFALAGAFVGVGLDGDVVSECRIALCGVADIPLRLPGAERAIVGRSFADVAGLIADAVRAEIDPSDGVECSGPYRRHVAGTVARRAWSIAVGDAAPLMAAS